MARKVVTARKVMTAVAQGLATLAVSNAELFLISPWCHTTSRGRNCTSAPGCPFWHSVCYVRSLYSFGRDDVSPGPVSDLKMIREKLWWDFFSDPSQWWDHRLEKLNPRYPDFKHKRTGQSLWLDSSLTPLWVDVELARIPLGLLQSHHFSWNVRLRRHLEADDYEKTLTLFQQMQQEGIVLDKFTFVAVLSACSNLRSLESGRRVHEQIIRKGCESDLYVATGLVDMYAKCGSINDAWSVFKKMRECDVVSWSAMIGGYVKSDQGQKALELFQKMQQIGVEPNAVTFVGALNACASVAILEEGRRVHEQIIQRGYESDAHVANCLVDMYAKCRSMEDAWSVFEKMREHNVVSWSAIIVGYVKCEQGLKALELFREMQQEGVEPNTITFLGALNACASVAALEEGRRVHKQITQRGYESNVYVANCLIDMYAKCGSIENAWSVFNKMRERDVVSWNAMIVGYVKSDQGLKGLELFRKMQQEGVEPDIVTYVGALNSCASLAALEEGKRVHEQIVQRGCESDSYVAACLIDMYAKCGNIEDALNVFNKMRECNRVSWNAMIGGYAMHGNSKEAICHLKRMSKEGIGMDHITFTCLLSACSHGGLVKEGLRYFNTMTSHYNVLPTREHFACMVDLLGRAGWLVEAEEMTERMPMERNTCVWMSLLGACRIHGNIEMAERAARRCSELDPENVSGDVLLWNIYAESGIEVNNVFHSCVIDDKEYPPTLIPSELDDCQ